MPSSPVAQNGQPTAQPACELMHSVWRSRLPAARRVVHQDGLDEQPVGQPVERLLGQAAVGVADLACRRPCRTGTRPRAPPSSARGACGSRRTRRASSRHTASRTWRAAVGRAGRARRTTRRARRRSGRRCPGARRVARRPVADGHAEARSGRSTTGSTRRVDRGWAPVDRRSTRPGRRPSPPAAMTAAPTIAGPTAQAVPSPRIGSAAGRAGPRARHEPAVRRCAERAGARAVGGRAGPASSPCAPTARRRDGGPPRRRAARRRARGTCPATAGTRGPSARARRRVAPGPGARPRGGAAA